VTGENLTKPIEAELVAVWILRLGDPIAEEDDGVFRLKLDGIRGKFCFFEEANGEGTVGI